MKQEQNPYLSKSKEYLLIYLKFYFKRSFRRDIN